MSPGRPRRLAALTLVIGLAFALRIYRLDSVPLRGDEAFSVENMHPTEPLLGAPGDEPVRRLAIGYALGAMQRREEIRAWIVDDTGFLKQGRHSVGV